MPDWNDHLTRESVSSLLGGQFGSYRVLLLLGAGGIGEVYRADVVRFADNSGIIVEVRVAQ